MLFFFFFITMDSGIIRLWYIKDNCKIRFLFQTGVPVSEIPGGSDLKTQSCEFMLLLHPSPKPSLLKLGVTSAVLDLSNCTT